MGVGAEVSQMRTECLGSRAGARIRSIVVGGNRRSGDRFRQRSLAHVHGRRTELFADSEGAARPSIERPVRDAQLRHESMGSRRRLGVAASLVTALVLSGCGAAHVSASTSPSKHGRHKPSPPAKTSTITRAATTTATGTTPVNTAPAVGTKLVTATYPSGGTFVLTSGNGFDVFNQSGGNGDNPNGSADESTISTYDAAGNKLAEIPSQSFTGSCGAADVNVAGNGRVLVTFLESSTPAQGITAATSGIAIQGWSATTGEQLWKTALPNDQSCNIGDLTGAGGTPNNFSATLDGNWGVVITDSGYGGYLVNLATGVARYDASLNGTVGDYVTNYVSSSQTQTLIDPATGEPTGRGPLNNVSTDGTPQEVPPWMFFSSGGQNPGDGLTSSGDLLVANLNQGPSQHANTPTVTSYSLPSMKTVWKSAIGYPYMWGDSGGVLVVGAACKSGSGNCLIGINDQTGAELWEVPDADSQGQVCGLTTTHMMLAINGQQAIVDLRTGKQISFQTGTGDNCPTLLPNGLKVTTSTDQVTVTQALTP
jgi:hypothetical protein